MTYRLNIGSASYNMTADGEMATADLKKYVEDNFGKAPVERDMTATVEQWLSNGETTVKTSAGLGMGTRMHHSPVHSQRTECLRRPDIHRDVRRFMRKRRR